MLLHLLAFLLRLRQAIACYVGGKFEAPKSCEMQTILGCNNARKFLRQLRVWHDLRSWRMRKIGQEVALTRMRILFNLQPS